MAPTSWRSSTHTRKQHARELVVACAASAASRLGPRPSLLTPRVAIEEQQFDSGEGLLAHVATRFDSGADLVAVWFAGSFCSACKRVAPHLEALALRTSKPQGAAVPRVKFIKVDCGTTPALAKYFEVRKIPTVLLFCKDSPATPTFFRVSGGEFSQLPALQAACGVSMAASTLLSPAAGAYGGGSLAADAEGRVGTEAAQASHADLVLLGR